MGNGANVYAAKPSEVKRILGTNANAKRYKQGFLNIVNKLNKKGGKNASR